MGLQFAWKPVLVANNLTMCSVCEISHDSYLCWVKVLSRIVENLRRTCNEGACLRTHLYKKTYV